jgi:hypothetical protein
MTTIFLVADERDTRGEFILSQLLHTPGPLGDTAGLRHPGPPDEAVAEVAARLDAVDSDWRRFVAVL